MHFSAEEVGAYIRLLCHQWMNGFIPEDHDKQARICGCRCDRIATVLEKFCKGEDGRLRNDRMERVRASQEAFSARKSAAGKAGAAKRWQPHSNRNASALPEHGVGNASLISDLYSDQGTPTKKSSDKALSESLSEYPRAGKKKLSPRQWRAARRFEDALGDQWRNDSPKWIDRVKKDIRKSEHVIAEVESAIKEGRINTTPAQYAEDTWKEFK